MKKILTLTLAAATLLTLSSCRFVTISDELKEELKDNPVWGSAGSERITASDNYITRNDVTGEFHALSCNLPGDVIYKPGDCAISIYAPDNILDHVTVSNEGGTLVVKSNVANIRNLKKIVINVSSPVMEELVFNGAVDFKAPEGITALDFHATVNGAGDMDIDGLKAGSARLTVNGAGDATLNAIDCDAITVAINGAGDASLSGKAGSADLTISGAGDIDARSLDCADINTKVRGVGSIKRPK